MGGLFNKPEEILSYEPSNEFVLPKGVVGVEVEVEGLKDLAGKVRHGLRHDEEHEWLHSDQSPGAPGGLAFGKGYWYVKYDGSLRDGGVEFVTGKLFGKDLSMALDDLNDYFKKLPSHPEPSDRCSVHVHIDVRDLSKSEFIRMLIDYAIFENIIFNYCGNHRKENLYCLPFARSDVFKKTLADMYTSFGEKVKFTHIIKGFPKYSALNVGASAYYCSLEFRQHGGTYDMMRIKEWINILMCLKKNCKGNLADNLHREISRYGISNYLERVFGKYSKVLDYNDCEGDILGGIRLAQDILNHNRMVKVVQDYFLNNNPFPSDLHEAFDSYQIPEPLNEYVGRTSKKPSTSGFNAVLGSFLYSDKSDDERDYNDEDRFDDERDDYDDEERYEEDD